MVRRRTRTLSLAALASAAVLGLSLVGSPPASAGGNHGGSPKEPKVIASGLDNPRQLSFTKSGALLVAESGEGGSGPCMAGPEGGQVCFGTSGAITRIGDRGRQSRIITGLPSLAAPDGSQATGPSDVALVDGHVTVLMGLGGTPETRAALPPAGRRMGKLIQTTRGYGSFRTIADLAGWEARHNPIADVDSNPVGLLVDRGRYYVADAGGNTVLSVSPRGRTRLVATFEGGVTEFPPGSGTDFPYQAVPTSVATRGWDGALYVSQLTGFPFPPGAANIYRVDRWTGETTVYASGLTNVTDLAFQGRTLYAVQISSGGLAATGPVGSVVRVKRGASSHTEVAGNLFAPYGIAIKGDSAYVTIGSVAKDAGQVLRIRL